MEYELIIAIIKERRAGVDAIALASGRSSIVGYSEVQARPAREFRHDPMSGLEQRSQAVMQEAF